MGSPSDQDLTQVLADVAAGRDGAAERVLPLVYDELRKLAGSMMANQPAGHTLQATALVHEAYLRIGGDLDPEWDGRRHFFFAAARAMRDILVEQARRKGRLKHGGGRRRAGDAEAIARTWIARTWTSTRIRGGKVDVQVRAQLPPPTSVPVDMGPYEYEFVAFDCPPDISGDGVVTVQDLVDSRRT